MKAEIDLLLLALEGFNHDPDPVRIGAETHNGRGRMEWELDAIHRLEGHQQQSRTWLNDPEQTGRFREAASRSSAGTWTNSAIER